MIWKMLPEYIGAPADILRNNWDSCMDNDVDINMHEAHACGAAPRTGFVDGSKPVPKAVENVLDHMML